MSGAVHSIGNRILSLLAGEERERLVPHLEYAAPRQGEILFEPDEPIRQVYFPNTGTVSIISALKEGSIIEVGVVGHEGVVGLPVIMGVERTPNRSAIVQIPGDGFRVRADVLRSEFLGGERLRDLLLRYTHAYITQISQSVACNRCHRVRERLARWLLTCHDRVRSEELCLTQEVIAQMLGIRRAGVSDAATALQDEGLISYRRGIIRILDRAGLERAACECYAIVREEFDRL